MISLQYRNFRSNDKTAILFSEWEYPYVEEDLNIETGPDIYVTGVRRIDILKPEQSV